MASKWMDFKKNMSEYDLCLHVIDNYFKYGAFEKIEHIYGVSRTVIVKFINSHKKELQKKNPKLMKKFAEAKEINRKSSQLRRNPDDVIKRKKLDNKDWETLPNKIKYKDFLNFIIEYETGALTGQKLVEIAATHGITVIG